MAKRKEPEVEIEENADTKQVSICKNCKKPIVNPNGDNGCGVKTVYDTTVTNCVPLEANG